MTENMLDRIATNNAKIAELLRENEDLFRSCAGQNGELPQESRIRVPYGVVSSKSDVLERYHLDALIADEIVRTNVSYCLETCDLYRFIIDRFNIYGPVRAMLYKNWYVCLVQVMEALVEVSSRALGVDAKLEAKGHKTTFRTRLAKKSPYWERSGLAWEKFKCLHDAYEERNRNHLTKSDRNELTKNYWTREKIEEAEELLGCLASALAQTMANKM